MRKLIVGTLLLSPFVSAQSTAPNECDVHQICQVENEETSPPCLVGLGGDKKAYRFTHIADVDLVGEGQARKYRYVHAIRNDHENLILHVEWRDVRIPFQSVKPGACAENPFESGIAPAENTESIILYGQTTEQREKPHKAPAYVPRTLIRLVPPEDPSAPNLNSRLSGQFVRNRNPFPLDLEFEMQVLPKDRYFTHVFANNGSTPLQLDLIALMSRWQAYDAWDSALKASGLTPTANRPGRFSISPKEPKVLKIGSSNIMGIREEIVEVGVFAHDSDDQVAVARVAIYLPMPLGVQQ